MSNLYVVLVGFALLIPRSLATLAEDDDGLLDLATGECDSLTEDCIEGYTSLLQDSVHLLAGHRLEAPATKVVGAGRSGKGNGGGFATAASNAYQQVDSNRGLKIEIAVLVFSLIIFCVVFYFFCFRPAQEAVERRARVGSRQRSSSVLAMSLNSDGTEDIDDRIHDYFDQDTYSLAIALLVRDLHALANSRGEKTLRYTRISFAFFLVLLTCVLQIMIVVCTKQLVTPIQVADIRDAYDQFEESMYDGNTRVLNRTGKQRGLPGFFNASAFNDLDDDVREGACNIPFSQFSFFAVILFVWTLTVMAALKKSFELFMVLIVFCRSTVDMKDSVRSWTSVPDPDDSMSECDKVTENTSARTSVQVICGLTKPVKFLLTMTIFVPEICTNTYLLWLGCRWLTATNDWGDIVSNAVALEFVLRLKELLFYAIASERNRRDLGHTGLAPPWAQEPAGWNVFFNPLAWALLAALWCYSYIMYFQKVLPSYQWDVHQVCDPWLRHILDASGGDD